MGFSILDGPTIDLMMVDPDHHRRGLGRLLLQDAEAALLDQYAHIRLESFADNAVANSFYEARGWQHGDQLTDEGPAKPDGRRPVRRRPALIPPLPSEPFPGP